MLGRRAKSSAIGTQCTKTTCETFEGCAKVLTLMSYIYDNGFKKPVDILNGLFHDLRKKDVYYPIHNIDYNAWRKKFERGGDFAIYTELRKIKLQKPIKFSLNEICKPPKQHS